jgi:hypothetical protein
MRLASARFAEQMMILVAIVCVALSPAGSCGLLRSNVSDDATAYVVKDDD